MLQQIAKLSEQGTFSAAELRALVAAFDRAWAVVEVSRAPFSELKRREGARETLAGCIIEAEAAKSGVHDERALSAGAIV
jgi:hypothetical protein